VEGWFLQLTSVNKSVKFSQISVDHAGLPFLGKKMVLRIVLPKPDYRSLFNLALAELISYTPASVFYYGVPPLKNFQFGTE